MREKYDVSLRFTNTDQGFVVTVNVEHKETHSKAERKEVFIEMPTDFESLITSVCMECE